MGAKGTRSGGRHGSSVEILALEHLRPRLLGPNGAGKTRTLECLEGLRRADAGLLRVGDVDPGTGGRHLSELIGVQLQSSALPKSLCIDEAMRFSCTHHGIAPRFDLVERVGLGDKRDAQYHELFGGQQRLCDRGAAKERGHFADRRRDESPVSLSEALSVSSTLLYCDLRWSALEAIDWRRSRLIELRVIGPAIAAFGTAVVLFEIAADIG